MLYLIRGLPGSGKTTLAREFNCEHFEADMFFTCASGRYVFEAERLPEAHRWCQRQVAEALEAGEDVVVSNTFTQRWELEPYLVMAEMFGHRVTVITCEGDYGSEHGVPEETIKDMRERWERL